MITEDMIRDLFEEHPDARLYSVEVMRMLHTPATRRNQDRCMRQTQVLLRSLEANGFLISEFEAPEVHLQSSMGRRYYKKRKD